MSSPELFCSAFFFEGVTPAESRGTITTRTARWKNTRFSSERPPSTGAREARPTVAEVCWRRPSHGAVYSAGLDSDHRDTRSARTHGHPHHTQSRVRGATTPPLPHETPEEEAEDPRRSQATTPGPASQASQPTNYGRDSSSSKRSGVGKGGLAPRLWAARQVVFASKVARFLRRRAGRQAGRRPGRARRARATPAGMPGLRGPRERGNAEEGGPGGPEQEKPSLKKERTNARGKDEEKSSQQYQREARR